MRTNPTYRPAGYDFLIERYELRAARNWHGSIISTVKHRVSHISNAQEITIFPLSYWPGDASVQHLEFALKYDGVNLQILAALFEKLPPTELTEWIKSKPTGIYTRKIWFLYEFITEQILEIEDSANMNYVTLLPAEEYYTTSGQHVRRHRIINNLPGTTDFTATVRRTPSLQKFEKIDIRNQCDKIAENYPAQLFARAMAYMYTKETKSSYAIEHINPDPSRAERFANLLRLASERDFCDKASLIEVQNEVVEPRFRDDDYRHHQNYIGETVSYYRQRVHYVCPKPSDLPALMQGLIDSHQTMKNDDFSSFVHAAIISYGFVFLHPFEDGNGRLHRFLIHNILSTTGVTPPGLIFPISAAMLHDTEQRYGKSLEAFSKPLRSLIDYTMNDIGEMTVTNETRNFYRFMDLTEQTEALCYFILETINHEIIDELEFLTKYDKTFTKIQQTLDMPDNRINLFIRLCLQNRGHLPEKKKQNHFSFLSAEEFKKLEGIVLENFQDYDERIGDV